MCKYKWGICTLPLVNLNQVYLFLCSTCVYSTSTFYMFYMYTCIYTCTLCVYVYNMLINTNGMVNIWKISFNTKEL